MKILIIDTDKKFASAMSRELESTRCKVRCATNGEEGLRAAQENRFDLIVLDWALGRTAGLRVLMDLRGQGNSTPILMLTAGDSVSDVVVALNSGADACVTKPFEIRILIARMNALVRRREWGRGAEICYAHFRLDPVTRMVWSDDKKIELTGKEYDLLFYFMQNPEKVVTRTMIAENVWGDATDDFTNNINVNINYLRKKIDPELEKKLIHTVIGSGYIFKTI